MVFFYNMLGILTQTDVCARARMCVCVHACVCKENGEFCYSAPSNLLSEWLVQHYLVWGHFFNCLLVCKSVVRDYGISWLYLPFTF